MLPGPRGEPVSVCGLNCYSVVAIPWIQPKKNWIIRRKSLIQTPSCRKILILIFMGDKKVWQHRRWKSVRKEASMQTKTETSAAEALSYCCCRGVTLYTNTVCPSSSPPAPLTVNEWRRGWRRTQGITGYWPTYLLWLNAGMADALAWPRRLASPA